jgi:LysM repeat protein
MFCPLNLPCAALIFARMKRFFVLLGVSASLCQWPAQAQETNNGDAAPVVTAATVAAKEGAEERYERMAADIQALQTANEALQAKITALEGAMQELRNQLVQAASNSSTQDELKSLAGKIEEVDRKREEDKQAISEEIRRSIAGLEKAVGGATVPARGPSPKTVPDKPAVASDKGFVYTVEDGQNLSVIVNAYNKEFKSKGLKPITMKQAKEANPDVDWNRLRVGQKIIIPVPESQ